MKFLRATDAKWVAFLLIFVIVNLTTVMTTPRVWQDEVQIVEFGRCFLEPRTDWSINFTSANRPAATLAYLGPLLQECAFRLTRSRIGPRTCSLLGAVIAAALCRRWLISRGIGEIISSFVAAIFLLEPTFAASYRGARVDSWTFALIFLACLCVRLAVREQSRREVKYLYCGLAGLFSGTAVFVWITAVLLLPLVVWELWVSAEKRRLALLVAFAVGGFIALGVVSTAGSSHLAEALSGTTQHALEDASQASAEGAFRLQWRELLRTVRMSPFLPVAVSGLALMRGNRFVGVAFLALLMFMLATRMYTHRYIYLLPYMVVILANSSTTLHRWSFAHRGIRIPLAVAMLSCLAFWSGAVTLLLRPIVALRSSEQRNHAWLTVVGRSHIGIGRRVILEPFEFYYVGRELGWKMYRPFDHHLTSQAAWLRTLDSAILLPPGPESIMDEQSLLSLGMTRVVVRNPAATMSSQTLLPFSTAPYGPYVFLRYDGKDSRE